MIIFKKLRYKNFLSTGDKFTEIDLNASPHTLIVGQNGSGKSTMLDALSFALFGKPHRNINKIQLINSVNNKGLRVEIEFEIGNKQYKVIRGYKPVKFEIYVDGVMINQNSHNKEYQKVLESNILKFNHKTFHQVVVLGSSSFIPFMQLGAYHRREVIEDLLDIGVFSKMNAILKEKNAALKEKINQVLHSIEINETKTDAQKKYIRDISKINNDVQKQKEGFISETLRENQQLVEQNAENQNLAHAISSEVAPLLQTHRDELASHNQNETETLTNIKSLVKEHKFYEKNETCPTCSQDISHELKERKLEDSKIKANELQSHLSQVRTQRETTVEELNELEAKMQQVNDLQQQVNVNLSTIASNNTLMEKAKAEIESLSNNHSDLSKANSTYRFWTSTFTSTLMSRSKKRFDQDTAMLSHTTPSVRAKSNASTCRSCSHGGKSPR
jgi:DNA repair exonuclease SbcCD ATPase subunit